MEKPQKDTQTIFINSIVVNDVRNKFTIPEVVKALGFTIYEDLVGNKPGWTIQKEDVQLLSGYATPINMSKGAQFLLFCGQHALLGSN